MKIPKRALFRAKNHKEIPPTKHSADQNPHAGAGISVRRSNGVGPECAVTAPSGRNMASRKKQPTTDKTMGRIGTASDTASLLIARQITGIPAKATKKREQKIRVIVFFRIFATQL